MQEDFNQIRNIHFVGIGGIGVSSLAQIMISKGKNISGSDLNSSEITEQLTKKGAMIFKGHQESNLARDCEIVIYSHAIPEENPELKAAKNNNIPCLSYPEALGVFSKNYYCIAVSGTHGKSTTTAMTALALTDSEADPTVIVGTKIKEYQNQNYRVGESEYLLLEACEYRGAFQNISPNILVITNIEAEHLDYFKTEENYYQNFKTLIERLPETSIIIYREEDKKAKELAKNAKAQTIEVPKQKQIALNVPGDFNQENATLALALCKQLNIPEENALMALAKFSGTWRRMEYKKLKNLEIQFIDDYAHHPTEVKATLKAIRSKHQEEKILCVFQPHQYSRTAKLLDEFASSFSEVDKVIIPNIYAVRDSSEDLQSTSPEIFVAKINSNSNNAEFGEGIARTAEKIKTSNYDLIVTMGAGDISSIYKLLEN